MADDKKKDPLPFDPAKLPRNPYGCADASGFTVGQPWPGVCIAGPSVPGREPEVSEFVVAVTENHESVDDCDVKHTNENACAGFDGTKAQLCQDYSEKFRLCRGNGVDPTFSPQYTDTWNSLAYDACVTYKSETCDTVEDCTPHCPPPNVRTLPPENCTVAYPCIIIGTIDLCHTNEDDCTPNCVQSWNLPCHTIPPGCTVNVFQCNEETDVGCFPTDNFCSNWCGAKPPPPNIGGLGPCTIDNGPVEPPPEQPGPGYEPPILDGDSVLCLCFLTELDSYLLLPCAVFVTESLILDVLGGGCGKKKTPEGGVPGVGDDPNAPKGADPGQPADPPDNGGGAPDGGEDRDVRLGDTDRRLTFKNPRDYIAQGPADPPNNANRPAKPTDYRTPDGGPPQLPI